MEIIKNRPNLHKVEPAINIVLEALEGLTIDEAKLCLHLTEDIVTGQSKTQAGPVLLVHNPGVSVGWVTTKQGGFYGR